MRLFDILFESVSEESAKSTVYSTMSSYVRVLSEILRRVQNQIAEGGSLRAVKFIQGAPKAKWVSDNFMGNRRSAGLLGAAMTLKREGPKDTRGIFDQISQMRMSAFVASGKSKMFEAFGDMFINLGYMDSDYTQIAERIERSRSEILSAINEYRAKLSRQQSSERREERREHGRFRSAQNVQSEEMVNNILSQLPPKVSGEIRNVIARSDNKLQSLMRELEKRGIQP